MTFEVIVNDGAASVIRPHLNNRAKTPSFFSSDPKRQLHTAAFPDFQFCLWQISAVFEIDHLFSLLQTVRQQPPHKLRLGVRFVP